MDVRRRHHLFCLVTVLWTRILLRGGRREREILVSILFICWGGKKFPNYIYLLVHHSAGHHLPFKWADFNLNLYLIFNFRNNSTKCRHFIDIVSIKRHNYIRHGIIIVLPNCSTPNDSVGGTEGMGNVFASLMVDWVIISLCAQI